MTTTTVLATAQRIQRHAGRGHRTEVALLASDLTSNGPTVTFSGALPSGIDPGTILSIDFELLLVTATNETTFQATVIRGYLGTTAAAHTAAASLVEISPRYALVDVVDAMQAEVAGWDPRGLYRAADKTLATATTSNTMELPIEWQGILGVIALQQSESYQLGTVWPELEAKLVRGTTVGFTGSSTGILLRFTESIRTGSVHVVVALPFDSTLIADPTKDLVTDVLLTPGLVDLLELGTLRRLNANDTESKTSRASQDEPRRSEETPLGSWVSMSQLQIALYRSRMGQEIARCRAQYPIRMS